MELSSALLKIAPHLSLVLLQFGTAGGILLSQVILVQGKSPTVFITYQFFVSALVLGLLALIFERKRLPPLTGWILVEIFFLALFGPTYSQFMFTAALYYVPSTIESSALNLGPAVMYILCVIIKQEKLQLDTLWGCGKILGTLISVSGAFCLFFWHQSSGTVTTTDDTNWTIGLLILACAVLGNCLWIITLGATAKRFPVEMSLTAIMMFFATIQIGVVAAVINHEASQWQLNWSLELLNIVIGGTISTGLASFLTAWCSRIKGAVFVTSFSPLGLLFTSILEFIFLGYRMNIGSVSGTIFIVLGLYMYLWSEAKENDVDDIDGDDINGDNDNTTSLLG